MGFDLTDEDRIEMATDIQHGIRMFTVIDQQLADGKPPQVWPTPPELSDLQPADIVKGYAALASLFLAQLSHEMDTTPEAILQDLGQHTAEILTRLQQ